MWVKQDATCLDALQDEQWDVIVIQDANFNAGLESVYNKDVYMTVLNYLYNNQEDQPRILFHMTWTNPDDYENYISAGSSLSHPSLTSWYIPTMEGRYGDENGVYQMKANRYCRTIYITIPAEYQVPLKEDSSIPLFYSTTDFNRKKMNRNATRKFK